MLKEMIKTLVQDPKSLLSLQSGQFQLAGISQIEYKALMDVMNDRKDKAQQADAFWC